MEVFAVFSNFRKKKMKTKEKEKKEKRKRKLIILFVILAFFIIFALIIKFIPTFLPFYQKDVNISMTVGNYTGIDVSTSALSFGTAMRTSTVKREVIITNEYPDRIKSKLSILGNLSTWTSLSEDSFFLMTNESKTVEVSVTVPEGAEFGNYSGKLRISFTR
jgi:cell division protein YceG involved in septum cleavage